MDDRKPRLAVLTVSAEAISKLDPHDPSVLGSLWSTFTRCAGSIENGHRLENMSWRLWNREIFQRSKSRTSDELLTSDQMRRERSEVPTTQTKDNSHTDSNIRGLIKDEPDQAKLKSSANESAKDLVSDYGTSTNDQSDLSFNNTSDHASVSEHKLSESATSPINTSGIEKISSSEQIQRGSVPLRRLSSQQIQKIFALFQPEKDEEDYWKVLWENKRQKKVKSSSRASDTSLKRVSSNISNGKARASNSSSATLVSKLQHKSTGEIKVKSLFARKSSSSISNPHDDSGRESPKHDGPRRNNTFTSIVRGFSPKNISVSAVHRLSHDDQTALPGKIISDDEHGQYSKQRFKVTKAPADKTARENMFFIESSPSDNDHEDGNSLSSNNTASPTMPLESSSTSTKPPQPENVEKRAESEKPAPKVTSLFAKSRSTSAISNAMREKYQAKKNESAFTEDTSEEEDEWDSVDDSEYSFDEKSLVARGDEMKRPLVRSSLLSSLFLNNPELVQRQQEEQNQKRKSQKKEVSKKYTSSTHSEDHHGSLPVEVLRENGPSNSSPSVAMSPRTIRRNMLATELSKSVKETLLWERDRADALVYRKSDGLRRSHTATGVPAMAKNGKPDETDVDNMDFDFNYHARGW